MAMERHFELIWSIGLEYIDNNETKFPMFANKNFFFFFCFSQGIFLSLPCLHITCCCLPRTLLFTPLSIFHDFCWKVHFFFFFTQFHFSLFPILLFVHMTYNIYLHLRRLSLIAPLFANSISGVQCWQRFYHFSAKRPLPLFLFVSFLSASVSPPIHSHFYQ